jgi:ATP-dependent exoDNAse (exonuclease V) beta subunit
MKKRNIKQSYNRILEISEDATQITLPDSRYYRRNGKYYPSVTYVLGYYPKGKFFENWLKQVGFSADYIVKKAAEEGTQVHELAEAYLNGEELNFLDERGRPQYNPDVWQMFLRFVEFWETFKPTLIETEVHIFSDELKVAGTCDLIVEINGELWLLDLKTSNQIQTVYELQTAVYGQCYEECFGKKIDRYGILWLKSSKRGPKKDKMQGKGWEVVESSRTFEENIDIFKTVKRLFDLENPTHSPVFTEFRTIAKREL